MGQGFHNQKLIFLPFPPAATPMAYHDGKLLYVSTIIDAGIFSVLRVYPALQCIAQKQLCYTRTLSTVTPQRTDTNTQLPACYSGTVKQSKTITLRYSGI